MENRCDHSLTWPVNCNDLFRQLPTISTSGEAMTVAINFAHLLGRNQHEATTLTPTPAPILPPRAATRETPRPRREPQWRASKVDARESALLEKLLAAGVDPTRLPAPNPPAPGLKTKLYDQLADNELFATRRSFERCWQHMRQKGILRYASEATTGFQHSRSSLLD